MGQRTLVVVPRPGGGFNCRYAHWGVTADPLAQSRPLGREWSAGAVLDELDASYERLLVADGTPRWYCVCWLDPTLAEPDDIVLARTDDPDGLVARWTEAKSHAVDAVADGLAPDAARAGLLLGLARRADTLYRGDDASFLGDDR
ncbi:hypothetical protein [Haloarcula salinisoli]|uniref:Uncharacterized protein n=1 Tax=Haloarcula salinisoli TaxID=2487746 RepID=A0A8J7YLG6_9EURY|nr:hypothetical protein [Halomicroarcula salinisoli]MBX0288215.1 hypothetical protein [Halomicroarcula salinisoli]MBX0305379.1 hypothetical protein [Halomicroarcula salinisoli]